MQRDETVAGRQSLVVGEQSFAYVIIALFLEIFARLLAPACSLRERDHLRLTEQRALEILPTTNDQRPMTLYNRRIRLRVLIRL